MSPSHSPERKLITTTVIAKSISVDYSEHPRRSKPVLRRGLKSSARSTPTIQPNAKRPLPCIYLGNVVTFCPFGDVRKHVHYCEHFDQHCTRGPSGALSCETCEAYDSGSKITFPIRFDHTNLFPTLPGRRFNPSIIDDGDGFVFCFRTGWAGSELYCVRLDKDFTPFGSPVHLKLRQHPATSFGAEDGRLFRFKGELYVMFTGVVVRRRRTTTNVLFARLNPDLSVHWIYHPQIPGRQSWEKNHCYVEHDGSMYAVYSIKPHRIGRVDGEKWEWAHQEPFRGEWVGGIMRGGCSPVQVVDEFWHFFHDRLETHPKRIYRMGLYTFDAYRPFAPRRWSPEPIMVADQLAENDNYCHCFFPGGSVLKEGRWIISAGIHDRWSEIHAFDHADLEQRLRPL
jgi:predicted GH43/DUF377 family glycosyl hydrolase